MYDHAIHRKTRELTHGHAEQKENKKIEGGTNERTHTHTRKHERTNEQTNKQNKQEKKKKEKFKVR